MADSILLLKSALEFARFPNPMLRQKVYNTIDRLEADLQSLDYEMDVVMESVFEDLEETVKELEDSDVEVVENNNETEEVEVVDTESITEVDEEELDSDFGVDDDSEEVEELDDETDK